PMILVPLFDLKFLHEAGGWCCRNFKSAALVPGTGRSYNAAPAAGIAPISSADVRVLATVWIALGALTRPSMPAAVAAPAAQPARGAPRPGSAPAPDVPRSGNVDVIIVGAGAAGIAAARRLAAAGRRFALLEAANEVGGRCITDSRTFGIPYDRGAHWIYLADN